MDLSVFIFCCAIIGFSQCQKPFSEEDIVVLNGNEDDLQLMMTRIESRQARIKAEKKLKKNIKTESPEQSNSSLNQASSSFSSSVSLNGKVVAVKKEHKAATSDLLKNGE